MLNLQNILSQSGESAISLLLEKRPPVELNVTTHRLSSIYLIKGCMV